jgi:HEAT repeat protein
LKDKNESVRRHVANALGAIGPAAKDAVPALEKIWEDDAAVDVRKAAHDALRKIDPKSFQD